tara:strand:+ start:1364 stop:1672 length:309 start_codon:yes stop_codon:yes gene_type:complete
VISISTTSDSKEVLKNISKELLKQKLTPCTHIIKISKSSYIWEGEVVQKKEYKLEIKTIEEKESLVIECIKKNHNYKTFELSKEKIESLNKEYNDWFKKQIL